MPKESEYAPLQKFLAATPLHVTEITVSFEQMELILRRELPNAAFEHRAWWANQTDTTNRPQARAWIEAGFHATPDQKAKWVQFVRIRAT